MIDTQNGIEFFRWLSIQGRLRMRAKGTGFRYSELPYIRKALCRHERTAARLAPIVDDVVDMYRDSCRIHPLFGPHSHIDDRYES